jgi:hypothetical protein
LARARRARGGESGVWLLPLVAVALTSLRSQEGSNRNFWGWPTGLRLFENATVLTDSACRNSSEQLSGHDPCVVGAVAFHRWRDSPGQNEFKGPALLMIFIGGNLVPFRHS